MMDVLSSSDFLESGPMAPPESRRQAILAAMIRVVGVKGYKETSVADVIEAAETSRTTFYKYFDDKHDCFLAAYELLIEQIFGEVVARCDGEASWMSRVTSGLTTIVDRFAVDPALARTAVVEVAAAGAEARQLHWNAIARLTEYLDAGRELAGDRELPENISLMSAGAVSGLIFDELLAGRADQLPDRLPDLLFAMLVPYVGPQAAAAEMRRAADAH
jgi:AcrR family transcriptional regulator